MNKLSELITTIEFKQNVSTISYLDYVSNNNSINGIRRQIKRDLRIETIVDDIDNSDKIKQLEINFPPDYDGVLGLSVFSKSISLTNSFQHQYHSLYDSEIFANNVEDKLVDITINEIKNKCDLGNLFHTANGFNNNANISLLLHDDAQRKIISKVIQLSNIIQSWGRIGPATNMIVNTSLKVYFDGNVIGIKIYYDTNCPKDKIYVYRNSEMQKSGLKFGYRITNDVTNMIYKVMYEFFEIGMSPEVFYGTINII